MGFDGFWWVFDGLWWDFDGIWWVLMGFDGILMGFDGIWWALMGFDGLWWDLMDFDGLWWVLMGFDGFWWDLMGFDGIWWVLMVFDGLWWVLMGFDGFWWDLMGLMVFDGLWWDFLIQLYCLGDGSDGKAKDIAQLMPTALDMEGCWKWASKVGKSTLADQLEQVISAVSKEDNEDEEPVAMRPPRYASYFTVVALQWKRTQNRAQYEPTFYLLF